MKKVILGCSLIFGLTFMSCSKDDDDNDSVAMTRTEMLCSGDWTMTSSNYVMNEVEFDLMALMDTCSWDNFTTYSTDGTLVMDENIDVCELASQTIDGSWEFSEDETVLSVVMGDTIDFNIVSISESEIALSADEDMLGVTVTMNMTFSQN